MNRLRATFDLASSAVAMDGTWNLAATTPAGHTVTIPITADQTRIVDADLDERTGRDGAMTLLVRLVIDGPDLAEAAARWSEIAAALVPPTTPPD